jgi:hypothetical protein
MTLRIRTMEPADLALALDWAAAEGWNPGLHDAAPFAAVDPDGLLIGELDGETVAAIACVRYDAAYGFVGLYLVREDVRGQGHGMALWAAGHEHLGDRAVALEGVTAQVDNYARSGYAEVGWTVRYEGRATPSVDLMPPSVAASTLDVVPVAFDDVRALDARAFPAPRDAFLTLWLTQPGTRAVGLRRHGALAGYGVLRPCRAGWKVGPLLAPDAAGADALLDALTAGLDGEAYSIDVPSAHPTATALAQRRGMTESFRTARMVRGTPPPIDDALVFGVTSLELG